MVENPVLLKELKAKFRWRQSTQVKIAVGVLILLFLIYSYWQVFAAMMKDSGPNDAKNWWQIGVAVHATLIWLLCPALASNAITQEKEQQTWEMLLFTRLNAGEILSGKLISRLLPIVGILTAFVPYMMFCAARGGAQFGEFFITYALFGVWIIFLVTVSLFMSWAFRKTATSIAMSYMVLFVLLIGTFLIEATISVGGRFFDSPIFWLNPIRIGMAMFDRNDHNSAGVLLLSTAVFLSVTGFLYWRMLVQFRAFSVE